MYIDLGDFNLDNLEKIKLEGHYEIKTIEHKVEDESYYENWNINCQAVYVKGNVLIRTDTENIEDLIRIFIRYTSDPCDDLELDFSVKSAEQMKWGTICPTRKILFVYKSKVFVAYGRYIYGYDKDDVTFTRGSDTVDTDPDSDNSCDEYITRENKIENNLIILGTPKPDDTCNEYVYSFMIYDKETEVVDAFGLYR